MSHNNTVFRIVQEILKLGCQTRNHTDDVVDLIGIGHIVRQCVTDFGVGDVDTFFAHNDELAQARAVVPQSSGVGHRLDIRRDFGFGHCLLSVGKISTVCAWTHLQAQQSRVL